MKQCLYVFMRQKKSRNQYEEKRALSFRFGSVSFLFGYFIHIAFSYTLRRFVALNWFIKYLHRKRNYAMIFLRLFSFLFLLVRLVLKLFYGISALPERPARGGERERALMRVGAAVSESENRERGKTSPIFYDSVQFPVSWTEADVPGKMWHELVNGLRYVQTCLRLLQAHCDSIFCFALTISSSLRLLFVYVEILY